VNVPVEPFGQGRQLEDLLPLNALRQCREFGFNGDCRSQVNQMLLLPALTVIR